MLPVILALATGGTAGAGVGLVLQRGQLCFHAAIRGTRDRPFDLARAWLLGVSVAAVGLGVVFLLPGTGSLNRGLALRPVANLAGGLVIGIGIAVARSCVSGLLYKLGSGMAGAMVGLVGWAVGELAARQLSVPGPTVLGGGEQATLPGLLGAPRLVVAAILLVAVLGFLWRSAASPPLVPPGQWRWPTLGVALGLAVTAAWGLAAVGGSSFGPSSVGAVASVATGSPNYWLIAFLLGIVAGAALAALGGGGFQLHGEHPVQYVRLALGGVLLGAGGWIAGGCNLGHGLSGMAQLNVSSLVVVAAMAAGVWLASGVPGLLSA